MKGKLSEVLAQGQPLLRTVDWHRPWRGCTTQPVYGWRYGTLNWGTCAVC